MSATDPQSSVEIEKLRREMARIELDPAYEGFLRDRNVIIVGPAETLIGSRQGNIIDSYDIVVRFNTAIQYMPFSADLVKDVGSRTDLLYCNNEVLTELILHQKGLSHDLFRELCYAVGIKYLISTNNDYTEEVEREPEPQCRSEQRAFEKFLEQQKIEIGFRMLYSTSVVGRELLHGYVGRTGFLAMLDLLAHNVRKLRVIGMTFYHKGGHLFLKDCVDELHPMKNHKGLEPPGNVKGHNSYFEIEVMRELAVLYERKLDLDEHVKALLDSGNDIKQP